VGIPIGIFEKGHLRVAFFLFLKALSRPLRDCMARLSCGSNASQRLMDINFPDAALTDKSLNQEESSTATDAPYTHC
jgi:hypothetical protein